MPGLYIAGEVVMAIEVPVVVDLTVSGATAGATGHTARDGNHGSTSMLPVGAD